jgi:hypothetical protein
MSVVRILSNALMSFGFIERPIRFFDYIYYTAHYEDNEIIVQAGPRDNTKKLSITVKPQTPFPFKLCAGIKNIINSSIGKLNRIQTKDRVFDKYVELSGNNKAGVCGLFNMKARTLVKDIFRWTEHFSITPERIEAVISSSTLVDHHQLIYDLIKKMTLLSISLKRKETIEESLVSNSYHDTNIDVRKHNIHLLFTTYKGKDVLKDVLENLIADPVLEIRCIAAEYEGEKGLPVLYQCLQSRPALTQAAAFHGICNVSGINGLRKSIEMLDSIPHVSLKLKQEVLMHIKETGDASFSSFLMNELKNSETGGVTGLVLDALGSCGSKDVLRHLYALLEEEKPIVRHKRMIKKTILQIKSRLGGDFKGWLSHTEMKTEEGSLSIAEPEMKGGLSVIEKNSEKPD